MTHQNRPHRKERDIEILIQTDHFQARFHFHRHKSTYYSTFSDRKVGIIKTIYDLKYFSLLYFETSDFNDPYIQGFRVCVSSVLRIYDDSSTRAIPEGGSKWIFKDDKQYWVYLFIENDLGEKLTVSWSMIVENLDEKVLEARSMKHTSKRIEWGMGTSVDRIDNEKEIKVTIVIKSLIKH